MINTVQKILEKVGKTINAHLYISILILLLATSFFAVGATKISFESDLDKMNPQDLEIIIRDNRVSDQFSTGQATLILIELDPNPENDIIDIRDPQVIEFTCKLKQALQKESIITKISSPSDLFYSGLPTTLSESTKTINQIPGAEQFFGQAYDWTMLMIESDIGNDEAKILELTQIIEEKILESGKPAGIKTTVTGEPSLMAVMFNFLINDSMFTLLSAAILIFLLLILIERSIKKAIMIMLPLLFGILFTLGTLGWLEISITIATAGLSAMLLGLGVEYSIFLYSRYEEERKTQSTSEAIITALSTTGASTVSSGFTTVIGFAALILSSFPMLSDMGASLAIGIGLILSSVMLITPIIIQLENKFISKNSKPKKSHQTQEGFLEKSFEKYGKILSKAPLLVIAIMILLTSSMFIGISLMQNQDIDFDTVLPEGLEELSAFKTIQNERGQTESITIFIEVAPQEYSDIIDIRNKQVAEYINILTQKSQTLSYIESVSSYTATEIESNARLFSSLADRKEYWNAENPQTSTYITTDYSGTIIRLSFNEDVSTERAEVLRQTKEMIQYTKIPEGITVTLVGDIAIQEELNAINGPDSSKTAIIAMVGVFILLLILSRSIKYTILPLFTVVGAIIWTLGLIGFTGLPFSSITSSVLSMTIGIGIDFGLQLSMRYRQDRTTLPKKEAMTSTLKNTLYPMTITVIAALIGFQAMSLGNLTMMADLGTTMGYSIISSMIVAITLVAALILIFDRTKT